ARPLLAGEDARADPPDRVHSPALLLRGVGVGASLRLRRGWAALVLGARRGGADTGRLRRRCSPGLAPRGCDRRGARGVQPAADLVLAGGAVLRAARAADECLAARVRPRPREAGAAR